MKLRVRFSIVTFMASLLWTSTLAQAQATTVTAQDKAQIDQTIQELLTSAAEINGQQRAKVKLLAKREKEAEKDLKKAGDAKEKAERELTKATSNVFLVEHRVKFGGAANVDMADYEPYERSIQLRTVAKVEVDEMAQEQRAFQVKLEIEQRDRQSAEEELRDIEAAQVSQRDGLEKIYSAFQDHQTEETFKALTGELTKLSAKVSQNADIELVTQDPQKNETKGALVYYESDVDRKNRVEPIKSAGCTTGCSTNMSKGWFYIWSMRNDRETSNKNRYLHVGGPDKRVELVEDRN
jgi:hypothetical protein